MTETSHTWSCEKSKNMGKHAMSKKKKKKQFGNINFRQQNIKCTALNPVLCEVNCMCDCQKETAAVNKQI